MKPIAETI